MFVLTVRRITPCGTLRPTFAGFTPGPSFSSNSGYGVSITSTTPGPLYATALFPDIVVLSADRITAVLQELERARPLRGGGLPRPGPEVDGIETESEFGSQIDAYRLLAGPAHLFGKQYSSETGATTRNHMLDHLLVDWAEQGLGVTCTERASSSCC